MIRALEVVSRVAVWIGGILLIGAAFMVTLDVTLRNTLGVTLGGADELAGYVLAISTSWAFSFTLLRRQHIRVDLVYRHVPAPGRAVLDLLSLLLFILFIAVLVSRATPMVFSSIEFGSRSLTPLQVPLAIPQTIWLAGLVLFLVTLFVLTVTVVVSLFRSRYQTIQHWAGIPTLTLIEDGEDREITKRNHSDKA